MMDGARWRVTKLFDLLRRRQDDTPRTGRRPEIAIFCGPGFPWSPADIEHKGLGGLETAAVRVADALTAYGCRVTVYGQVPDRMVGQVIYKPAESFDPMDRRDLVINSCNPELFDLFDRRVNAGRRLLWMHVSDFGDWLTEKRAGQIDRVMALSKWHHRHLGEMYPFVAEKLYTTRNGIEPRYFQVAEPPERNPHRAVYSSSPNRGLDFLLKLWPDVRELVPDAELVYCYPDIWNAMAETFPDVKRFVDYLRSLEGATEGAVNLGPQSQPGVAKVMLSSGVWLAPSWTPSQRRVDEVFCIGAVEAAAAGCRRVMSQWGALIGRTESDYPQSRWLPVPDRQVWVEAIAQAMTGDLPPYEQSQTALGMTWEEVAADMLAAAGCEAMLDSD